MCIFHVYIRTCTFMLIFCFSQGDEGAIKSLLQQGANPNTKDNAGWTPLVPTSN